jgi:hypothetical protein
VGEGKEHLVEHIDNYIMEKMVFADRIIAKVTTLETLSSP